MRFLQNIRNALIRFMYGRNGMDHLNQALIRFYLLLWLLSMLLSALKLEKVSAVLNVLMSVLMLYIFFRMLSKNLYKRRDENQRWISWWWGVKNRASAAKTRHADKDHKYFSCKNCQTICRVPAGKGKIVITCPKCGAQIHAKT